MIKYHIQKKNPFTLIRAYGDCIHCKYDIMKFETF